MLKQAFVLVVMGRFLLKTCILKLKFVILCIYFSTIRSKIKPWTLRVLMSSVSP